MEQRKQDGVTRVSLNTIVAPARQLDPDGKGVAHTAILENEEAYACYKKFRTAGKPVEQQQAPKNKGAEAIQVMKLDLDQSRVRQRYMKLNRTELVDKLLLAEQSYAQLHERWLTMNDKMLEWQLRDEQAETQLNAQRQGHTGATRKPIRE